MNKNLRLFQRFLKYQLRQINTLVIAEHNNQIPNVITRNAVVAAKQIGNGEITILVAGMNCKPVSETLSKINGVTKILEANNQVFKYFPAENLTLLVLHLQNKNKYTHIIAGSSSFSKALLPRVASKLNVSPVSDVTKIYSQDTFARCIYSGSAIQKIKCKDEVKILTMRSIYFDLNGTTDDDGAAEIEQIGGEDYIIETVKVMKREYLKYDRPQLDNATVVVSGGRGLRKKKNFKLIYDLADKMNAAVGCTRAAVDAGFAPSDYQIGQSGKIVAPKLYVAVGISGAIQHLVGMRDSKVIVAINKNKDAAIFKIADYGIVGDLFKVVPELISKL